MNVVGYSFLVYWLYQNKKKVFLLVRGTEFVFTLSKSLFGRNVNKYMWLLQYVIHALLRYHTFAASLNVKCVSITIQNHWKLFMNKIQPHAKTLFFPLNCLHHSHAQSLIFSRSQFACFLMLFFLLIILFKRMIRNKTLDQSWKHIEQLSTLCVD